MGETTPPPGTAVWLRRLSDTSRPGAPTAGQRLRLLLACWLLRLIAALHPLPGRRSAWRETARCIGEFRAFRLAAAPRAAVTGPDGMMARAADLCHRSPRSGLWAAEGLALEWPLRAAPRGADDWAAAPAGALVPLHAGLGQALARRRLPADGAIAEAVDGLRSDLARRAAPGCRGVALEAVGFYLRVACPAALGPVDGVLRQGGEACRERLLLWHGVGRSLYFLFPRLASRDGGWEGWERLPREAPAPALASARSGFLFAFTLSQLDPALLATFLGRHGGGPDAPPFVHGLTGAAVVHAGWAGDRHRLSAFVEPRPLPRWEPLVAAPVRRALLHTAPRHLAARSFDDLFHLAPRPGTLGAGSLANARRITAE